MVAPARCSWCGGRYGCRWAADASVVVGGAAGGLVGKFAKHRVEKGLEKKMGDGLEPGWAGIVAIYDRSKAGTVDDTLVSAVKKSSASQSKGAAGIGTKVSLAM